MEAAAVFDSLAGFWDPVPHTGLPCLALIQRGKGDAKILL